MSGIGCPTHEELTRYSLGEIAEADAEAISRHLESCDTCEALLTETEPSADGLIELCRQPPPLDRYSQEAACHDAINRAIALGAGFADATEVTPADDSPEANGDEEEEPTLGQMGDYRLLEELSHGGMGTVYRAVHVRLDREVALKVLPKGRNTDQRAVARFEREMAAVGKLDHPNIVRATDAGEVDGVQYLAMELIDGFDLTELVDYLGPMDVANACEVIRQAAIGLQCAYEQGLVHRDIKPSNVMVTGGGVSKVLDLGLARFHIDKQSNVELTTAGQPMGTADYMAPEQVADTHSVDIRADIYSLGCTFYKILAGQPPFGGVQYSSSFDKMMAHRKEMPPPVQEFRSDLPKRVMAILEQMLAKDPDERFQTPNDLAESLYPLCAGANLPEMIEKAWQAAESAPVPSPSDTATPDEERKSTGSGPAPRRKRRGPGLGASGSSTQSASRSQYSNFYVMPPPPKPQWGLWIVIAVLSTLLMSIIGAYLITVVLDSDSPDFVSLGVKDWNVPVDVAPVETPALVGLSLQPERPPLVRGSLGGQALVAAPAKIDGLESWTLETVAHRTPILAAALDPAGDLLATGSGEGAVRIWNLGSGTLQSILINPGRAAGEVRAVAWAPSGDYLAAAYEVGQILVWDVEKGLALREFDSRSFTPGSVAWSPSGKFLAYVGASREDGDGDGVQVWDAAADRQLPALTGPKGTVTAVAFAPDGAKLAAGGSDRAIYVWDTASQAGLATIEDAHEDSISALAWSPCASMVASSCTSELSMREVCVWRTATGERLGTLPAHTGGDRCLVWLTSRLLIGAGGGRDGRTRFYDLSRAAVAQIADTGQAFLCRAGTTEECAAVEEEGAVHLCEQTGVERQIASLPFHAGTPSALAFAPNGRTIACGSDDGAIRFLESASGTLAPPIYFDGAIQALVYSSDSSLLALTTKAWNESRGEEEVATEVIDTESGNSRWTFRLGAGERIDDLAWSPDGTIIATVGDQLRIWDGTSGEHQREFPRPGEAVAWSADGAAIAIGSKSGVGLVHAENGSDIFSEPDPTQRKRLLAWSSQSGLLAATGGDAAVPTILLFTAEDGRLDTTFSAQSHKRAIDALGWLADGKTLLSGSATETCTWDAEKGERTNLLAIGTRAFSPDGTLSAGEGPSTIRLQRSIDGTLLFTVLSMSESQYAVIAPDGNYDGSKRLADRFVYVVQSDKGQAMLDANQFREDYGWQNDPSAVVTAGEKGASDE